MLRNLWFWLLGEKWGSSVGGVALGALTNAAVVAASGNLDTSALATGAAAGAAAALLGASGRRYGENNG